MHSLHTRLIPTIVHNCQGYTGSATLCLIKVFNDTIIMCQYCTYLHGLWCVKPEFKYTKLISSRCGCMKRFGSIQKYVKKQFYAIHQRLTLAEQSNVQQQATDFIFSLAVTHSTIQVDMCLCFHNTGTGL